MSSIVASMFLALFFAVVGEGYSSSSRWESIEAGWRMFTIYAGQDACANTPLPSTLSAEPIRLAVGEKFLLNMLVVTAHDTDGTLIPRVPISIGRCDSSSVLVRDMHANEMTWIAEEVGVAEFSIGGICPGGSATATVQVIVGEN